MSYHDKAWRQTAPLDRDEDEAERPTHCQECQVELEGDEDVLCTGCVAEVQRCPYDQEDEFLEGRFEERVSGFDSPF